MATERDLLRALHDVLASAHVDAEALVEEAWTEARDEVYATLKRLMTRDLLQRCVTVLGGDMDASVTEPADGALPPQRVPATDTGDRAPTDTPTADDPSSTTATSPTTASAAHASASGRTPTMTYLFGIVSGDTALPAEELPSLPSGGELRFVDGPGCRALVSDVDPGVFEVLREPSTEGLDLLAEAAHAHDGVLARFAGTAVLPLGLGTAVADDATVVELLTAHARRLQAELERVRGHAEWAVTVHTFDQEDPDETTPDAPSSGREYLQSRRSALDAREERWGLQDRLASELHGPLSACAVESQRVESRPLEEALPPLLHGVYLLDESSRVRFESTVAYLQGEYPQALIEVSGPWPPYHFVSLNLGADDGSSP